MPVCSAYGCNNRSGVKKSVAQKELEKNKKITFHAIPKDPVRRESWIKAIRRVNWTPSTNAVICSEHFHDEHFDRSSLACVRLRENAVPTIFKFSSFYLKRDNRIRREAIRKIESQTMYILNVDVPNGDSAQISNLQPSSFSNDKDSIRNRALCPSKTDSMNQLRLIKYKCIQKIHTLQQYKKQQAKKIIYLSNVLKKLINEKFSQDHRKIDILNK